jgi:hypothetical protein
MFSFQMVSLLKLATVTEEGVRFLSPHDGSPMYDSLPTITFVIPCHVLETESNADNSPGFSLLNTLFPYKTLSAQISSCN